MDGNKNNRSLLIGTITYAVGSFGTKFLNFLIVPLYTYYILPTDLGDYDLLMTTVSLLSPLLTLKISEAAYRWIINKSENELPYISATYKLLLRNCIICALFLAFVNVFIPIWNCYYFIAILLGDRILECLQKLLRGLKNQKLFAASGLFHTIVMVSLNVVKICYLKEGVTALLQSSVISIYATIILIFLCEKRLRRFSLFYDYKTHQREMLAYSVPLVPSALAWWAMNASDRYVIRWVIGSAANGIYSVAYKFPSVLQTFLSMFNNAWTDMALAKLDRGERTKEYTKKIFEKMYKLSFGLVFVLIPMTKVLMRTILSISYREAAVYIGFLYLGTIFQGFSSFCSIGYLHMKKTTGAAKTSVCGAGINLLIDILCVRYIGLFAASFSTFMGFLIMWIVRMRDVKDVFPIEIDLKAFSSYFCVGVTIAVFSIWTSNVMDIILACIFGLVFILLNMKNIQQIFYIIKRR